jgi:hypothetical protein
MINRASVGQQIMKAPKKRKSSKKWIQGAIKQPGALRKKLGVKPGKKISKAALKKATRSKNPTTRRQANLAVTLGKLRKKKGRS